MEQSQNVEWFVPSTGLAWVSAVAVCYYVRRSAIDNHSWLDDVDWLIMTDHSIKHEGFVQSHILPWFIIKNCVCTCVCAPVCVERGGVAAWEDVRAYVCRGKR
jgi:hypothetical protein